MTTRFKPPVLGAICVLGFLLSAIQPQAQQPPYRTDQILVKPRQTVQLNQLNQQLGTTVKKSFPLIGGLQVVGLPAGLSVEEAIEEFETSGLVWYAVPDRTDWELATHNDPDDPSYTDGTLWGLENMDDHDIDALDGWHIRNEAPGIVIAVTDTGVRYTHEDLAGNMWTNPDEIAGNSIDDDGNGFVDDVYGADTINDDGDPMDDSGFFGGHGTHVSGTIAAVGDNNTGVVGVAWEAQIMAVKVFTGNGATSTSALVDGINYAIQKRAHIINASWSGEFPDPAIIDAISAARNQGILFVAAAGNNERDIDSDPRYPAAYDLDNIVSVAASTRADVLADYSNWGAVKTHLAAPGGDSTNSIYSTWRTSDSAYQGIFGTSMATPHVAGALALLHAYEAVESYVQLKNRLLSSTDALGAFSGLTQTEGRLNLNGALSTTFWRPPNNDFANAFEIARPSSVSAITFVANNVDATKQSGEPNHAGNSGGKSVWWNWQAPSSASVTFTTLGSGFDTLLAVYTGSAVSSLTSVVSDDNSGQCGTSQLTFNATSNVTYRIAVDGYDGAHGTIKLTIQTNSAAQPASLAFDASTVQRSSGQFQVTVNGPASASVTLDTSSDLIEWNSGYASFSLSGGGSHNYTDSSASPSVRFYRVRIGSSSQDCCNVVGYVDRTLPTGYSMVGNPLSNGDNMLSTILPVMPDGTTVSYWDESGQNWASTTPVYIDSFGWYPDGVLAPGDGVVFNVPSPGASVTFVGEVAQGHGVNAVPNNLSIRSSIVSQGGRLSTDLHFPVINGDEVLLMVDGSGTYDTYTYSSGAWSPSEPVVEIGEAFWSDKNVGFWWHRNFLVWP